MYFNTLYVMEYTSTILRYYMPYMRLLFIFVFL